MVNKTKILSDLSKIAVDAMSTFSGLKKEVETIVSLKINQVLNKMQLVKREEFEVLKKIVQKMKIDQENHKNKKDKKDKKDKKNIRKSNGLKSPKKKKNSQNLKKKSKS